MTALDELKAALQDARTEAATLRIAARAALTFVERIVEHRLYLSDEDQATDVVRRIEEEAREIVKQLGYNGYEWAALRVVSRPAHHAFLPTPFYPDRCDAKVDEDGRIRTCGRPRGEHP